MESTQSKPDDSTMVEHYDEDGREKETPTSAHQPYQLDGVTPVNGDQMPKGYYYSPLFLGSYFVRELRPR